MNRRAGWKAMTGGALLAFGLSGCAWFQEPPGLEGSAGAGADLGSFQDLQATHRDTAGGMDSTGVLAPAPADSGVTRVAVPPPAPGAPPESLTTGTAALAESTTTAPAESAAAPAEQPPESDRWNLDGTKLTSATLDSGQVIRVDHPVITHQDLTITAVSGSYDVEDRLATLTGDVRFRQPGLRGESRSAIYDRTRELLTARGDVSMETDTLRVTSDQATFDRNGNVVHLSGHVRGWRGTRLMASEQADWFRGERTMILRDNVVVTDSEDDSRIQGQEVLYDIATDRARVTERPSLLLRGKKNVTRIYGTRLWAVPGGDAQAVGDVRVVRGGVTASADSASFLRALNRATLFGNPEVVERDGTLTGDTLSMVFDEDQVLHRVEVHGNAGVRFEPQDSLKLGEVSTVRGDSLTMFFTAGVSDSVLVFGHAYSTYRPAPTDLSKGAGTNAVKGDSITIYLADEGVDRVRVTGNAKGVFTFVDNRKRAAADSAAADSAAADSAGAPAGIAPGDTTAAPPDSAAAGTPGGALPGPEEIETTQPTQDRVIYSADQVLYNLDDKTVDLMGETTLDYGSLTLTCGKVRFYAERRYLDAEDHPVLVERTRTGERNVVGMHMDYNLDTRQGTIDTGRTKAEDGFIYADRLRQIGEGDLLARSGNFTTCDLAEKGEKPHFHFTSKRMRIYMNDKVVAKPVTLYIRDIPILAIPFYVFSIRKGRQSGFLTPDFDFGLGSTTGRFFRNLGYYWAASDYYDFTLKADYQDRPSRFVGRLNTQYAKRYLMSGQLNLARTLGSGSSEYDITGAHQMTLGAWRVTGRAAFRSAQFRQNEPLTGDFGARLDRKLTSDLSASRTFPFGGSLTLTARQDKNLGTVPGDGIDQTILTETLPSYSFSLNSRPVGRLPDDEGEGGRLPFLASLRYQFSSNGSSVRQERENTTYSHPFSPRLGYVDSATTDTTFAILKDRASSATHRLAVSDTRRILGAFNLSPQVNLTERWVDREFSRSGTEKKFARAATWNASMSANTALYGTMAGIGPVQALRHVFRPSASFTYQPQFTGLTYVDTAGNRQNRYPGVSGGRNRSMSLSVDNTLQAKVRSGDEVKRMELLHWTLSSGYDFTARDRGQGGWAPMHSDMNFSQIYGVGLSFTSDHDVYRQFRFTNFQATGSYSLRGALPGSPGESGGAQEAGSTGSAVEQDGETNWESLGADSGISSQSDQVGSRPVSSEGLTWNAGFSFTYRGSRPYPDAGIQTSATLNGRFEAQITKNWSLTYSNNWDLTQGKVLGEQITLRRDLHCWEAEFTRNRLPGNTSFYFRINVKALRDIKYEQGRNAGSGLGSITNYLP